MKLLPLVPLACAAHAFTDTSPFILLSTAAIKPALPATGPLVSSASLQKHLLAALTSCPTSSYVIVSHAGVAADDLRAPGSAPRLRGALLNGTRTATLVPEVVGGLGADAVQGVRKTLEERCGASVMHADAATGEIPAGASGSRIIMIYLPPLPSPPRERAVKMNDHDSFLHAILSTLDEHTLIYTTTPSGAAPAPAPDAYEMDNKYGSALHTDLKRDLGAHPGRYGAAAQSASLFERYVFLSPGVLMGLLIALPLFSILYVALSAIAGLKVSYHAFSKEMGPSAQKK